MQLRLLLLVVVLATGLVATAAPSKRKNVLLLISDDLRPELNVAYGQRHMVTPNLDKLAQSGVTFDRAYTNFAICSASRNSFLSGRSPDRTQVANFINNFRQSPVWDNAVNKTLPQYFKDHGYLTLGAGKLFHPDHPPNNDEPFSWSADRPYYKPYVGVDWDATVCPDTDAMYVCVQPTASSPARPFNNSMFADWNETQATVANLQYAARRFHDNGTNFFIGLGVTKPHAKWHVPQYFYDQYVGAELPLPRNAFAPADVPDIAFTAELDGKLAASLATNATGTPGSPLNATATYPLPVPGNNTFPDWFTRLMRAGYYSAVSMADYHLGVVLDALDALGLANDTLVVFAADHGYQLGEHTEWAKHTNFELAVHVPMILRAPWLHAAHGTAGHHTASFTELLDLYPTVAALAGLPPVSSAADGVDGDDVSALLANPGAVLKTAAFAQYSRCPGTDLPACAGKPAWCHNNCESVPLSRVGVMGYTVRTAAWRFTEWYLYNGTVCAPEWAAPPVATELYAHAGGPPAYPLAWDDENANVAAQPEHTTTVAALRAALWARFRRPGVGCPRPH